MSTNGDKEQDFLFSVFTELNEHIRATDEKNVLIAGSFVALIAVVAALAVDRFEISWKYFVLSVFILLVGFCVHILQSWYREWKEHYFEVCRKIRSRFSVDDEQLPFWLREQRIPSTYSADKFLLILTSLINLGVLVYSCFLLSNLLDVFSCAWRVAIVILDFAVPIATVTLIKRTLINRRRFLHA